MENQSFSIHPEPLLRGRVWLSYDQQVNIGNSSATKAISSKLLKPQRTLKPSVWVSVLFPRSVHSLPLTLLSMRNGNKEWVETLAESQHLVRTFLLSKDLRVDQEWSWLLRAFPVERWMNLRFLTQAEYVYEEEGKGVCAHTGRCSQSREHAQDHTASRMMGLGSPKWNLQRCCLALQALIRA